jgi:hypothetical protein
MALDEVFSGLEDAECPAATREQWKTDQLNKLGVVETVARLRRQILFVHAFELERLAPIVPFSDRPAE